jgi:hypothetical protein
MPTPKGAFDVLTATEYNQIIAALTTVQRLLAPPLAMVRRAAAQSIATGGVGTNIVFDTEDADSDVMFTAGSDTVTIQTAGKYEATLFVTMGGSGQFYQVTHNVTVRVTQSGGGTANLKTPTFTAAVADTIKCAVFQSSGVSQNLTATLSVRRVSD